jgi:iron complex transport system ATP-binding protein
MSDPELVLLDEPFAGLDLGARERLLVQLAALAGDPESPPIVLVTHHCEEIPPGFTHGGLVRQGALMAAGPLCDVVTSERVSACFGVPVTVGCTAGRWWSRAT